MTLATWARTVKEIDGWKCVLCGRGVSNDRKYRLESHHIEKRAIYPDMALDVDNGVCLCHECHVIIHGANFQTGRHYPDDFRNADFSDSAFDRYCCTFEGQKARRDLQEYVNSRLVYQIENDLLERFKATCAARGDKVNTVLREAMERYVADNTNEK